MLCETPCHHSVRLVHVHTLVAQKQRHIAPVIVNSIYVKRGNSTITIGAQQRNVATQHAGQSTPGSIA
jgi:hypothetical protein